MFRESNEQLLENTRIKPCLVCNQRPPSHPHHVKTRGSGGGDHIKNLMPLCFKHHREVHDKGLMWFSCKYLPVKNWLEKNGWEVMMGKWWNSFT